MTSTLKQTSLTFVSKQSAPPIRPKPVQNISLQSLKARTDPAGRCLREQHQAVSTLSDDDVYEASVQAGIITPSPSHTGRVLFAQKSNRVETENLRDQLADFNAFTQFMTTADAQSLEAGEGLPKSDLTELWVREKKIDVQRKGTGLGESDDGTYEWVFWRDAAGVVRSAVPREGNPMVKTVRATRWPSHFKRWSNLSFDGRDAHKPWERNRYVDRLCKSTTDTWDFEKYVEKVETTSASAYHKKSTSVVKTRHMDGTSDVDSMEVAIVTCDEVRKSNRYATIGGDMDYLQPWIPVEDPEVLRKIADIKRRSELRNGEHNFLEVKKRNSWNGGPMMDAQTLTNIDLLRQASRNSRLSASDRSAKGRQQEQPHSSTPANGERSRARNLQIPQDIEHPQPVNLAAERRRPTAQNGYISDDFHRPMSKPLPPLPLPLDSQRAKSVPVTVIIDPFEDPIQNPRITRSFLGLVENRNCTLLRLETIEALKLYSQRDFCGFMDRIHQYKGIITLDIRNNLNRGPIFNAAMVKSAVEKLIKAALEEYLPLETFKYVRDIMFHYLANRNLKVLPGMGHLRWRPLPFDTNDFNAMNHLSEEYCDGFFKEVQDIIRIGYGTTEEERWKGGAAVSALLYTACLTAMDIADKDNALYAKELVRAVGIVYNAAEALVLADPIFPKGSAIDNDLLKPMAAAVTNKIQSKYSSGALRSAVVTTFRDTYVVGAIRGERISGMRSRKEDDVAKLIGDEKLKSDVLMAKRRAVGKKFDALTRMYVNALGEQWPKVKVFSDDRG
jgi:hypothetical protein